jgi:protein-tyrosine kinase
LLPTEASVLASHMGQVVLVIEAEKTSLESVNKSIDSLSNSIVLMLLNKMRENGAQGAYGSSENYEEQS